MSQLEQNREFHLLENDAKNTVKYELHLSREPDEQLVEHYTRRVNQANFELKPDPKRNLCYGSVKFDQDIEEEWLIVYILYELSKFDSDLVIRVFDNDGDILLIEAAEYLPRWLESSKSKNRNFIHKGKLHIIPEHINLKELLNNYRNAAPNKTDSTVAQAAAQFIRDMNKTTITSSTVRTLADSKVQQAIQEQLSGLPDTKVWLSKKFKQLDDIISENIGEETRHLDEKFKESLSLASVMAMNEEDLRVSPISSISSSVKSTASSSSWLTEDADEQCD